MFYFFFCITDDGHGSNNGCQDPPNRYGIKFGETKTTTEMMGQKVESHSWFGNYGELVASKDKANAIEDSTITRNGKSYMVNRAARQVREMPAQESINYLNLDEATIANYIIKEVGIDIVAGKECIKYSLEEFQMGQTPKLTVSVWNEFPMKTVTIAMGIELLMTITEIKECEVDTSLFEIHSF